MAKKDDIRKDVEEIGVVVEDAFRSIAGDIQNMFANAIDDGGNMAEVLSKDIERNIKSMARGTDKLISLQGRLSKGQLSQRDIGKEIIAQEAKRDAIIKRLTISQQEGFITQEQLAEKSAELTKNTKLTTDQMHDMSEEAAQIKNRLGGTGAIMKGLSKIPILGDLIDANEALDDMKEAAAKGTSVLAAGFKSVGGSIMNNMGPAIFAVLVEGVMRINQEVVALQKNLGISGDEAREFRNHMAEASAHSNNIMNSTSRLMKMQGILNQGRGTGVKFAADEVMYANQLLTAEVLTESSLQNVSKLANINNKTFEETYLSQIGGVMTAEKEHGVRLDIRSVLEEVNKIEGQIAAQLGADPERIAKSVAKAKALGMELQQVANIGKSLLNFEESINAELEAELLTGKQLNLERARLAALTGDYDTLMEEINKNVGDFGDFSQMNVLQQEALAQAHGMTADQLSNQLMKKADLVALEAEARAENKHELADHYAKLTAQQEFNLAIERMKELFIDKIGPGIERIVGFFSYMVENAWILHGVIGLIATVQLAKMGMALAGLIPKLVSIVALEEAGAVAAAAKWVLANPFAAIGVGVLVAGAIATVSSMLMGGGSGDNISGKVDSPQIMGGQLDDFIIQNGEITSFNKDDLVIGGTNLGGGGNMSKQDYIDASLEIENRKSKQPIVIKSEDTNYASSNVMNNTGNHYSLIYESSFA